MRLIVICMIALFNAVTTLAMISVEDEIIQVYNRLVNQTTLPELICGTPDAQTTIDTLSSFSEEQNPQDALDKTLKLLQRFSRRFDIVYRVAEALPYLKNQEALSVLLGFRAKGLVYIGQEFDFADGAIFKKCASHLIPQCKTIFSDEDLFESHLSDNVKDDLKHLQQDGINLAFSWEKYVERKDWSTLALAFMGYLKYELTMTDHSFYDNTDRLGEELGYDAVNIKLFGSLLECSLETAWQDSYFGIDHQLAWIVYNSGPGKESADRKFAGYRLLFSIAKAKWEHLSNPSH